MPDNHVRMSERKRSSSTKCGDFEITRRPHSEGTNLADKSQPSILVTGPGFFELMGRWTLLCLPAERGGATNALDATDEQIVWALTHDESVFDY